MKAAAEVPVSRGLRAGPARLGAPWGRGRAARALLCPAGRRGGRGGERGPVGVRGLTPRGRREAAVWTLRASRGSALGGRAGRGRPGPWVPSRPREGRGRMCVGWGPPGRGGGGGGVRPRAVVTPLWRRGGSLGRRGCPGCVYCCAGLKVLPRQDADEDIEEMRDGPRSHRCGPGGRLVHLGTGQEVAES